jgi:hypothetical protein
MVALVVERVRRFDHLHKKECGYEGPRWTFVLAWSVSIRPCAGGFVQIVKGFDL